jgi:N-acetylneuraminic acid mutarotase
MKKIITGSLIGALFLYGCGREIKQKVKVEVSGSVSALVTSGEFSLKPAEGAIVKLQADINGDGKILKDEMERVNVDPLGRFETSMWIPKDFKGNVVLVVEKEGYASIIKTFPAEGVFQTNIVLYPVENATCKNGKCYVPSKKIVVENIPENVSRGEMAVFNPVRESDVFPGNFFDSEGKMLISTVFGEIKLYDENGNEIKEGKDIKVKMLIPVDTYGTLEDLNLDTEKVEVPMFYFDEAKGVWVESVEGWLEYEGGKEVKREELQSIKEGKYAGNIYSVFYAPHLSWWNVDWKNPNVTCLMGRVLIDGVVTRGVEIKGLGINYTLPEEPVNCYTLFCQSTISRIITKAWTDEKGWFVISVYKSEPQNKDEDGDGIKGEIHKTSISASYNGQTWNTGEFVSPERYSPYMEGNIYCNPPDCVCENIGDINLSTASPSQPCELYGIVRYSGIENIYYGSGNPPPAGSPVPGVNVAIFDQNMSPERRNEICIKNGQDLCVSQTTDNSGKFHIYYAVDTSATYSASLVLQSGDVEEGFRGSGTISGCPSSSPDNPYVITVDYYYRGNEKYPTAPQALTASAECGELVALSWIDRSDNEDGFIIERKKEGENYQILADLPPDTNFHYDSTTKRNTSYCYRVIAYRTEGGVKYSSPSNEFCYTTPSKFCPPPPPSPSNLSGNMSPSLVSLTWKEVSRERGYKITRRVVTDGPCSEGGEELPIETVYKLGYIEIGVAGEDASSFTDSRVKPLTCYCYRVFAFNDAGNSGSSNPFCGIVPECNEGEQRACYTGPQGTLGIGVCSAGIQTCSNQQWGTCEGEVLPSDEICGDELDNDCDGYTDETCPTVPPETILTSYPSSITISTTAIFEFTCNKEPCSYECQLDNLGYSPCTSPVIYTALSDGSHTFNVYAIDSEGNVDSTPENWTWTIDSIPPQTTINSHPQNPTNSTTATFEFSCDEGNCIYRCKLDGGGYSPCISPITYSGLSEGSHSFYVYAIDSAGNVESMPESYSWTIDTHPPETTITSSPQNPTNSTTATFEFSCDEGNCIYRCKLDGGGYSPCISPITYSGLSEGSHSFYVYAIDSAGNVDPTPANYSWTIEIEWQPMSITNAPSGRDRHTAVWTGSEMIVWGGHYSNGSTHYYLNTGARYNPSTDSWTPTSTINAPWGREAHSAVWTGSEMIVWGGWDGNVHRKTGGRYNPSTDTWILTSTTSAPQERGWHTAVWTGNEMIIWGGEGDTKIFNTGGRYNPSTDSWTETATTNAPSPRYWHVAVWSGSEMIIWGGTGEGASFLTTGGRYNPSTDSWAETATANAPSGRWWFTAVWSGSEMIIWGGYNETYPYLLNTGGRYNPLTDTWISTSTINAPSGRKAHTAVWTGTEMIIWGGWDGNVYLNTGGRYNPLTDTWIPTSTTNAPSGREAHTAVWTGTEMIIWGGYAGSYLNTGARYFP